MIGGLQGEFRDLDIKYLKQKISKCRSQISGSFRRNSVSLCKMAAKFSQQKDNILATKGWFRSRAKFFFSLKWSASNGCNSFISTLNCAPFEVLDCWQWLSSRMLHGRFLFVSPPCILDLLMAKDFKASVLHVYELSIAFPWIPKNSPQSWSALVIKKLSKHQNLTQFD